SSETYYENGKIATTIDKLQNTLTQYDQNGNVMFVEKIDRNTNVTYRNGQVAAIEKKNLISENRTVTLYDDKGQVTTSIALNKDDQVNFQDGYLSSVIKHKKGDRIFGGSEEIIETQYNSNGKISSVTHKVQINDKQSILDETTGMYVTTSHTTYHDNGKLASITTYKQKHKKSGKKTSFDDKTYHQEGEADSYISSIEQYDENGKKTVSLKLNENDDVSYNGDKIAMITRRDKEGIPQSTTSYNADGTVANITNYGKDGKVISSLDYENGHPVRGRQEGTENYQDIFAPKQEEKTEINEKIALIKNKKLQQQAEKSEETAQTAMETLSENAKQEDNTPVTLNSIAQTADNIANKHPTLLPQEVQVLKDVTENKNANHDVADTVTDITNNIEQHPAIDNGTLSKELVAIMFTQIMLLRKEIEELRKKDAQQTTAPKPRKDASYIEDAVVVEERPQAVEIQQIDTNLKNATLKEPTAGMKIAKEFNERLIRLHQRNTKHPFLISSTTHNR
ncbi:MAG: hypothetical protein IJX20_05005, partial [Alphaproteobacteria bacterium]|nr:hypothetical protein [Alphaproteobacteria bacterium]